MTSDREMIGKQALQDGRIASDATAWLVRQRDGELSAEQWLAFSDWLDADSRHAAAFDVLVAADERLDGLGGDLLSEDEPEIGQSRPVWLRYAAGFAAIAAVLALALLLRPPGSRQDFESLATAPGETRQVALGDTIRIEMNGATRIELARGDAPVVRLKEGEAAFYITSPEPSKLRVEAGGLTLVDRGTSFDVIHDRYGVRVAVGSGKVVVNPERDATALSPGQTLLAPTGSAARTIGHIAPADMASWREKRLSYSATPLPLVAADLSRTLGVTVRISPELSQTRLTGVIPTTGKPSGVIGTAALMAGGTARQQGLEWVISAR